VNSAVFDADAECEARVAPTGGEARALAERATAQTQVRIVLIEPGRPIGPRALRGERQGDEGAPALAHPGEASVSSSCHVRSAARRRQAAGTTAASRASSVGLPATELPIDARDRAHEMLAHSDLSRWGRRRRPASAIDLQAGLCRDFSHRAEIKPFSSAAFQGRADRAETNRCAGLAPNSRGWRRRSHRRGAGTEAQVSRTSMSSTP